MQIPNISGKSVAIMVAGGFDENGFIAIQRALMASNVKMRIVSRDIGLTNSWNGKGWGMSYPVDGTISTSLAVDYDALIIPSGERHIATLSTEAHATRILKAFVRENMPVLVLDEAVNLLDVAAIEAPALEGDAEVAVLDKLVVGRADALAAALRAFGEAYRPGDRGSVAA